MSMINAFISCETDRSYWSRNYSLFGAIIGTAFILGPQISAFFISYFQGFQSFYFILLFCCFLSLMNWFLVYFWIYESEEIALKSLKEKGAKNQCKGTLSFKGLDRNLLAVLAFMFGLYFSWLSFIKFFQVHLADVFLLSESDCCQMTSFLGFCGSLWQGLRFFIKFKFTEKYAWLVFCTLLMLFNFAVYSYVDTIVALVLLTFSISFAYAALSPSILSLLFKQGEAPHAYKASLYQSSKALAQILAPLSSGYLLSQGASSPYLLTIIVLSFVLMVILFYRRAFQESISE